MTPFTAPHPALSDPAVQQRLGTARLLLRLLSGLSVATLIAAFFLRHDATAVNWVVWVRGAAVAAFSFYFLTLLSHTEQGHPAAFRRLRLLSSIIPVGILLIIVAPDNGYPTWMKWEQGVVGVLLLAVAVVLSQAPVRQLFRAAQQGR